MDNTQSIQVPFIFATISQGTDVLSLEFLRMV